MRIEHLKRFMTGYDEHVVDHLGFIGTQFERIADSLELTAKIAEATARKSAELQERHADPEALAELTRKWHEDEHDRSQARAACSLKSDLERALAELATARAELAAVNEPDAMIAKLFDRTIDELAKKLDDCDVSRDTPSFPGNRSRPRGLVNRLELALTSLAYMVRKERERNG